MSDPFAPLTVVPIGVVSSSRGEPRDDHWGGVTGAIRLDAGRFTPDALLGLEAFSHLEVVFHFHEVAEGAIQAGARHPRNNPAWPKVGIFAQRGKMRPNRLAVSVCELVAVDGLVLTVRGLDAIDGTPVLDLKPVMHEFIARGPVRQPAWATELMANYYTVEDAGVGG